MKKKVLIGFITFVALIGVLGFVAYKKLSYNPDKLAQFFKDNPERTSLYLTVNDSLLVAYEDDRRMPLASTVKTILAIEFAKQASFGQLDPNEMVELGEMRRFYIAHTDGGAHPAWLNRVEQQGLSTDGKVSLHEIAKGMIWYSSNANTEYLMMRLGLDNINNRLDSLGIADDHDPIYPFISSLYLYGDHEQNKEVAELNINQYRERSHEIFGTLQQDTTIKTTFDISSLSMRAQEIWSDNLPASTTSAYADIMDKMNSREFFSSKVHSTLDPVMEVIMTNPANQEWLDHSGMKGGSTAFVLTKALYATTKDGTKIELTYFLNDLSVLESTSIQQSMNAFELQVLQDKAFREKLSELLSK